MIRKTVNRLRRWWEVRQIRRNIAGTCPECGAIIRWDLHGRDVPPNPLSGREHWPGVHYRCPDARPFTNHGRELLDGDGRCDLRPHDLEPATEDEIETHIEQVT